MFNAQTVTLRGVDLPSLLAGEGSSVLPHAMMGEGFVCRNNPSPIRARGTPLSPLPQGERAQEARAARFGQTKPRAEAPTCGCRKRSPAPPHCLKIVIYNEWRNSNVLRRQRAVEAYTESLKS